jgi:hypothetical protein
MAAGGIDLICGDGEQQNFTKPPRFLPNHAFELGQHLIPRRVAGAGRFISESPHEAQASSAGLRRRPPEAAPTRLLSAEDEKAGQGVFTSALLNGLRGDADADGDGHVSAAEVRDYLVRGPRESRGWGAEPRRRHPARQRGPPLHALSGSW